jgi:hypothetical protein
MVAGLSKCFPKRVRTDSRKIPGSVRRDLNEERFCPTITHRRRTWNWLDSLATTTSRHSQRLCAVTVREFSKLPVDFSGNAVWPKKRRRKFS